ncbi:TIGR02588 family protein [Pseudomonas sp. R2.Fl]|nr:TIGR02588 family protein [Pseudomonas sp. R2.Fl]
MASRTRSYTEAEQAHWIEWITGIVSALLVAGLLGWIGYEALTNDRRPPELTIRAEGVEKIATGFRVAFEVENHAETTAAAVVVRGDLVDGGETVESVEVTFDYVPAQSRSAGAMIFSRDPQGLDMRIQPAGYTEP